MYKLFSSLFRERNVVSWSRPATASPVVLKLVNFNPGLGKTLNQIFFIRSRNKSGVSIKTIIEVHPKETRLRQ